MTQKNLGIKNIKQAQQEIPDLKVYGNGDTWVLLCKASSEEQGWMKSTKVMNVPGGCVIQVSTQQVSHNGTYAVAEAVTFVPGVWIDQNSANSDPYLTRITGA